MPHKHLHTVTFCLLICGASYAQQIIVSAGNEAKGPGGSSSYSVGQTAQKFNSGPEGSVTEGINQPYEIFVITGLEEEDVKLQMSLYPNPATLSAILVIENTDLKNLSWILSDVNGKQISSASVKEKSTIIPLAGSSEGVYFLYVNNGSSDIKIFKLIKHK